MASNEPPQGQPSDENTPKPQQPIEMAEIPGNQEQNTKPSLDSSSATRPVDDTSTTGADIRTSANKSSDITAQPASVVGPGSPQSASQVPATPNTTTQPPLIREMTGPAIGPATDKPSHHVADPEQEGPVLFITLLLTTGARHPFKLDRKYLRKRSVEVEGDNPVNMSLYKLKELILRDWRDEWDSKPTSPDSIRLISMGKLLSDKSRLSDFGFKENAAPAIVHMSIKPQDLIDEEEANKNVRSGEANERTPRCRCTLM